MADDDDIKVFRRLSIDRCHILHPAECSNGQTSEAAGEKQPEAYFIFHPPTPSCQDSLFSVGYVEDCFDPRTKLDERFSVLLTCTHLSAITPFLDLRPVPGPIVQLRWYDEALR